MEPARHRWPYGGMSVWSATGVECAPTPTWPGGPKIGRRRPARHGPPGDDDLVAAGSCAVLWSTDSARSASAHRPPAPARRAPRALGPSGASARTTRSGSSRSIICATQWGHFSRTCVCLPATHRRFSGIPGSARPWRFTPTPTRKPVATRSPGSMGCSAMARTDPLLQTIATNWLSTILNQGILPGGRSWVRTSDPSLVRGNCLGSPVCSIPCGVSGSRQPAPVATCRRSECRGRPRDAVPCDFRLDQRRGHEHPACDPDSVLEAHCPPRVQADGQIGSPAGPVGGLVWGESRRPAAGPAQRGCARPGGETVGGAAAYRARGRIRW